MKYGLIGCGSSGINRHIRAASANPRIKISGVCDIDKERAAKVGSNLGVPWYAESAEIAKEVDILSIATPPGTHYDVMSDVIRENVDMLVEKPFTTTLERANKILRDISGKVTEVNNQLFYPIIDKTKKRIAYGDIGEVGSVIVYKTKELGGNYPGWIEDIPGGLMGEDLPHWIYHTRNFLGDVERIRSIQVDNGGDHAGPLELNATLQNEKTSANLTISFRGISPELILIVGEKAAILVNIDMRTSVYLENPAGSLDVLTNNISQSLEILFQTISRSMMYGETVLYRKMGIRNDRAYMTDGHYRQLSELCDLAQGEMTVTRSDILNNVMVYEELIKEV